MEREDPMKYRLACTTLTAALLAGGALADEKFTYWSMWNEGEPQQRAMAATIEEFTAATGIEVDVQWVGRDIHKKVGPTLNSPQTPFTLVDGSERKIYSSIVSTGNEYSLNDVYAATVPGTDQTVENVLLDNARDVVTEDGVTWLVPYILFSSSWWYDAARMPELKGNEPDTWDALVALFSKNKGEGRQVIAQDGDIGFYNLYYFTEIAVRHMGPGNLNKAIEDTTGEALKDPRILRTAEQIQELVEAGFFADGYDSSKWPSQQQKWAAGNVDFIYNGTWLPREIAEFLPEGAEPVSFQMPKVGPDAVETNEVGYIGFAIADKGPDKEAAEKFVTFFMQKEHLARMADLSKVIVPAKGIEMDPVLQPLYAELNSGALTHAAYDGVNTYHADYITKVLTPLVNELIFGEMDAPTFQNELVDQTVLYWELNG